VPGQSVRYEPEKTVLEVLVRENLPEFLQSIDGARHVVLARCTLLARLAALTIA